MHIKSILPAAITVILLFHACSGAKHADRKELAQYVNALESLRKTDLEETAVSAFRAVSGKNNRGDKPLYQALLRCTLPNYSAFYTKLRAIQPEDTSLSNLHLLYTEGARFQLLAFSNVSEYLISKDREDLRRFQEQSRHADSLIRRWKKGFEKQLTAAGKR